MTVNPRKVGHPEGIQIVTWGSVLISRQVFTNVVASLGRKTPDASACRHRLLASRGGGGWNEQTCQSEIRETTAAENKARPP